MTKPDPGAFAGDPLVTFTAPAAGRLDLLLTQALQQEPPPGRAISRASLATWIKEGRVTVGATIRTKPSHPLQGGEKIALRLPPQKATTLLPETHEFEVLFVDDHLVVVNKPVGLRVHGTPEDPSGSLVAGLLGRGITLAPAGGELRPGVVHRLDKTTSGVMLLARTDPAYYTLIEAFQQRTVEKQYRAITRGPLPDLEGVIDMPIGRHHTNRKRFAVVQGGKPADTAYRVEERYPFADLVHLTLGTGRTHQIRVHLQYLGAPVMGDSAYGGRLTPSAIAHLARHALRWGVEEAPARAALGTIAGLMEPYPGNLLHAAELGLVHPSTGTMMRWSAPPPDPWQEILALLTKLRPSVS